jgi:hypothetical protein
VGAAALAGARIGGSLALADDEPGTTPPTAQPSATPAERDPAQANGPVTEAAAGRDDPVVPAPAYTRKDDDQPLFSEWETSRGPAKEAEKTAAAAVMDRTKALLATKGLTDIEPVVAFNHPAQTLFVASDPQPTWTGPEKALFERSAQVAACTELSDRLKNDYQGWPYGRYAVMWRELMTPADSSTVHFLNFGKAQDGCDQTDSPDWNGNQTGLDIATIPSTDKNEIRTADATVKAIRSAWASKVTEGQGLAPLDPYGGVTIGFDPVERVMYVWSNHLEWGLAQRSHFRETAASLACDAIATETRSSKTWPYRRYAVAMFSDTYGSGGFRGDGEFIASGNCAV